MKKAIKFNEIFNFLIGTLFGLIFLTVAFYVFPEHIISIDFVTNFAKVLLSEILLTLILLLFFSSKTYYEMAYFQRLNELSDLLKQYGSPSPVLFKKDNSNDVVSLVKIFQEKPVIVNRQKIEAIGAKTGNAPVVKDLVFCFRLNDAWHPITDMDLEDILSLIEQWKDLEKID